VAPHCDRFMNQKVARQRNSCKHRWQQDRSRSETVRIVRKDFVYKKLILLIPILFRFGNQTKIILTLNGKTGNKEQLFYFYSQNKEQ